MKQDTIPKENEDNQSFKKIKLIKNSKSTLVPNTDKVKNENSSDHKQSHNTESNDKVSRISAMPFMKPMDAKRKTKVEMRKERKEAFR